MKDESGGKILMEFVTLRPKAYSYLTDHYDENRKAKCKIKCIVKRKVKFEDYKSCLKATKLENKINQLEKINLM